MAGIGFQLKKILKGNSYFSFLRAYGYASVLSSGPWLLAVLGIVLISLIKFRYPKYTSAIIQFQTSVAYLLAFSLMLSGLLQFSFTRFVSDLIYEKRRNEIVPNFVGALLCTMLMAFVVAVLLDAWFFINTPTLYRILMVSSFIVLCANWLTSSLLSGLKNYNEILLSFFIGYGLIVGLSYLTYPFLVTGLMLAFFIGQVVLLAGLLVVLFRNHYSEKVISFEFLRAKKMFATLVVIGVFYNVAVWVDKLLFWAYPFTHLHIIGPLFASPIYDLPIFFSYLTMVPGLAVFLFRLETDFVAYYDRYYRAIRSGDTLTNIVNYRNQMAAAAYYGLLEIAKVQGFMIVLMFMAGHKILPLFGISVYYTHILNVATIAAALQVLLLGLINIFFYLDKRWQTVLITAFFLVANVTLTMLTLHLGVYYYAYGVAGALLLSNVLAFILLDHNFRHLEYMTFMMQ